MRWYPLPDSEFVLRCLHDNATAWLRSKEPVYRRLDALLLIKQRRDRLYPNDCPVRSIITEKMREITDEVVRSGTISCRILLHGQSFPQSLRGQFEELPETQLGENQTQHAVGRLILPAACSEPTQVPIQTLQVQ